jgi:hypothetical protein
MKVIIYIFSLQVILSACQKENPNLGPYYHYLIGEWKSINSTDETISIEFSKKGVIKISKSTDRAMNFLVGGYSIGANDSMKIYYYDSKDYGNQLLVYHKVDNNDTIQMGIFQKIESFTIDGSYSPTFVKVL